MTIWEMIGHKPRRIRAIECADGEIVEIPEPPFRMPLKTIGKPRRVAMLVWKPQRGGSHGCAI